MHNNKKNQHQTAPDARDFLGGNYLKKEDVTGPMTVTIEDVRSVAVPNADRKKLVMWFRELAKPLILNNTNTRKVVEIFRTTNTAVWRGPITLYVEPSVEYGGRVVGGIRMQPVVVTAPAPAPAAVSVPLPNGYHEVGLNSLADEADSYRD